MLQSRVTFVVGSTAAWGFVLFTKAFLRAIFSRENLAALLLCLFLIALLIVTADTAPQWIYQGF